MISRTEREYTEKRSSFTGDGKDRTEQSNNTERITYRTITRTEFQKRRASFENREDGDFERRSFRAKEPGIGGFEKKAKSVDELATLPSNTDPYRIKVQEQEMTEKLKDIHRMIEGMQEMTKMLKERRDTGRKKINTSHTKYTGNVKVIPVTQLDTEADPKRTNPSSQTKYSFKSKLIPVRYRTTISIGIGSKSRRFREEVEIKVAPQITMHATDKI